MSDRSASMQHLKPMAAVAALYCKENAPLSAAIMAGLSRAIFDGAEVKPATRLKIALSRVSHRVLSWTTRIRDGHDDAGAKTTLFNNPILERTGHAYATALLTSSNGGAVSLVEGGDPMNGPYMLIVPEIKRNCGIWDRLFLDSVQGRDVQCRLVWETRATYAAARDLLQQGKPVRMKAVAAGTGLSIMLVYDKLMRDGFDPSLIIAHITDRDAASVAKANCLLDSLAASCEGEAASHWRSGITAEVEDAFVDSVKPEAPYDIVTAIGILEYFQGHSYTTTEDRLKIDRPIDVITAQHLISRLTGMTKEGGHLIINSYRNDPSTRILELFGKRFDYRHKENVRCLLAEEWFRPVQLVGSGNIYDVKVYVKDTAAKA